VGVFVQADNAILLININIATTAILRIPFNICFAPLLPFVWGGGL
jgi:hypothetical protein